MVALRHIVRHAVPAIAVLLPLLLAGCGDEGGRDKGMGPGSDEYGEASRMVEEAIEKDAGSKVDVAPAGGGVRIRGRGDRKDYSFAAGGKIKVPDRFPADVSLYPGAEVRMAQMQLRNDLTITFETTDDRDRVLDFYRRDAEDNGWQFLSEAVLEDEVFLGYGKEGKALTVSADPEGDRTFISISYKVKDF